MITKLSWYYCIAIGSHNTNANVEERNSVKYCALKKNSDIIIARYPCLILHNALCKVSKAFSWSTGFDITANCVDLSYWFDRSSKKSILK